MDLFAFAARPLVGLGGWVWWGEGGRGWEVGWGGGRVAGWALGSGSSLIIWASWARDPYLYGFPLGTGTSLICVPPGTEILTWKDLYGPPPGPGQDPHLYGSPWARILIYMDSCGLWPP